MDIKFDREVLQELLALSPPGLDELMSLIRVTELMQAGDFDRFVLDSAASGHLLRLLELPHQVRDWLKTVFRMLIKHKAASRMERATQRLVDLSKEIRKVQEILSDPRGTEFVLITIAEEMGVAEMGDMSTSVQRLGIPSSYIVVNMVIPSTPCDFCSTKRQEQQRYIRKIEAGFPDRRLVLLPLLPHDVRGMENLRKMGQRMYGGIGERAGISCP